MTLTLVSLAAGSVGLCVGFKDGNHYERLEVSRHEAPHRWGWFKGQEPLWEDPMEDRTA